MGSPSHGSSEGVPVESGGVTASFSVVDDALDGGKYGAWNGMFGGIGRAVAVGVTVTKTVSVALPRSTLTVALYDATGPTVSVKSALTVCVTVSGRFVVVGDEEPSTLTTEYC
jgi:hypothetical protein